MSTLGVIAVIVTVTFCLLLLMVGILVVLAVQRAASEDATTVFHGDCE